MLNFRITEAGHRRGFTPGHLGFIPGFLSPLDQRPAREQINEAYRHGGGWRPFNGFVVQSDGTSIKYPGDPAYPCLAEAKLREETIRYYDSSWVGIFQPDGSAEFSRLD